MALIARAVITGHNGGNGENIVIPALYLNNGGPAQLHRAAGYSTGGKNNATLDERDRLQQA